MFVRCNLIYEEEEEGSVFEEKFSWAVGKRESVWMTSVCCEMKGSWIGKQGTGFKMIKIVQRMGIRHGIMSRNIKSFQKPSLLPILWLKSPV